MQSKQRYMALQAVEPKRDTSVVLLESHCGQATSSVREVLRLKSTTLETTPPLPAPSAV